jgi:hypothetical protein
LLDFANGCLPSLKRLEVRICFNKDQDEDGQSAPIPGVIEQLARAFENKPLDKLRVEVCIITQNSNKSFGLWHMSFNQGLPEDIT